VSPSTRLRLLYNLLVYPVVQHGLGITPGQGKWKRVKGIVALHDEEADKAWVDKWTLGGDWRIGLLKGLGDKEGSGLGEHVRWGSVHHARNETLTLSNHPLCTSILISSRHTPSPSYLCR
jgi:anoctamin-10